MSGLETHLAPGLLVATPGLPDPNFARTVVFLMEHTERGAMGLVVNRAMEITLARLFEEVGFTGGDEHDDEAVLYGGPVAPGRGWVLHDSDWTAHGSVRVAQGVSLSSSKEALQAIAEGVGPTKRHVCLGYSGWGPLQLEHEIALGSWIPLEYTPDLLFDVPVEDRWERALRDNGIEPIMVSTRRVDA